MFSTLLTTYKLHSNKNVLTWETVIDNLSTNIAPQCSKLVGKTVLNRLNTDAVELSLKELCHLFLEPTKIW